MNPRRRRFQRLRRRNGRCRCGAPAVWRYDPAGAEHRLCDGCVSRGCSCNIIDYPDGTEEYRDEQGRLFPCCEYSWIGKGNGPKAANVEASS